MSQQTATVAEQQKALAILFGSIASGNALVPVEPKPPTAADTKAWLAAEEAKLKIEKAKLTAQQDRVRSWIGVGAEQVFGWTATAGFAWAELASNAPPPFHDHPLAAGAIGAGLLLGRSVVMKLIALAKAIP